MTGFADAWRKAGQPQDDYDPANGSYRVAIVDASAFAGRDGREWAKCVLQIIGTPNAGRRFDHFLNLNNEVGLRIARESLAMYGMDVSALEDPDADIETLHAAMQPLIGVVAHVAVSHKDGFRNTKVDGAQTQIPDVAPDVPSDPPASFAAAAAAAADEPIPF